MITLHEILERDKRPPSVTVYMICYNHAKYLGEAIHGVLMQKTNFPVSIVIHDDASTDKSAEIIRRYAKENPNITAIIEETNFYQNGKSFLPLVIPHLTGKYIAYCECDDFWRDENKLQVQIDYLEANLDCIGVYSNIMPVNQYSQYDEAVRPAILAKTEEGDYPRWELFNLRHQLASCVHRNFWQFMTPDDIDFYTHLRAPGDRKIAAVLLHIGRVHHFSEEFAAYRHVIDKGDSYSSRMSRIGAYGRFKHTVLWTSEIYVMIQHFFGKKYYHKYLYLLNQELRSLMKFRKSVIKDSEINQCYHFLRFPAYLLLPFYIIYKVCKKILKLLMFR